MILAGFRQMQVPRALRRLVGTGIVLAMLTLMCCQQEAWSQTVDAKKKVIIGATADVTEVSTGFTFPARVDTGAKSCSLHVEKVEIEDESPDPLENVGKPIRFLVKNDKGESAWIKTEIVGRVRIRTAATNKFDRRYKVSLNLQFEDFQKVVTVTLNDRAAMTYPLLIGRNFLRGDFLVDVDKERGE
jgi:hypothetical protein